MGRLKSAPEGRSRLRLALDERGLRALVTEDLRDGQAASLAADGRWPSDPNAR